MCSTSTEPQNFQFVGIHNCKCIGKNSVSIHSLLRFSHPYWGFYTHWVSWMKRLCHAGVLKLSRGCNSNGAHLEHPWSVVLWVFYFQRNTVRVCSTGCVGANRIWWGWLENLLSNLITDLSQTGQVDTASQLCKYSCSLHWEWLILWVQVTQCNSCKTWLLSLSLFFKNPKQGIFL